MAEKLTRLTHRIAIQMHIVAVSCIICSSRARLPVRKLMDTSSYVKIPCITSAIFYSHNIRYTNYMKERHSEKLTVAQLVKKFRAFYVTRRPITVFIGTHQYKFTFTFTRGQEGYDYGIRAIILCWLFCHSTPPPSPSSQLQWLPYPGTMWTCSAMLTDILFHTHAPIMDTTWLWDRTVVLN
jgi:hypothetical protein